LGKGDSTFRERERLVRTYENMKNEIQTYENNLGFLSSSSKKGSSIVTELTRKVEKLKGELELVKEKIRVIDAANAEETPQA
jgi:archaellum component FlaC